MISLLPICIEWDRGVCGSLSLPARLSSPPSAPLPRSTSSFYPCISPLLANESEIFSPLVSCLLTGKWMQLNGRYWEIFCAKIWFVFGFCSIFATANEKRTASNKSWPERGWLRMGSKYVSENDISKVTYLWLTQKRCHKVHTSGPLSDHWHTW